MTGGWISQADRSRWQQRAAAELAVILAAHPDLPVIAWTVTASGGALSGQVLAPAAGRRGLFGAMAAWRWGWTRSPRSRPRAGRPVYLHARGIRGGVTVSVAATVFDAKRTAGEPPREPGLRGTGAGQAVPGSRGPAGKAHGRGAPGVPG